MKIRKLKLSEDSKANIFAVIFTPILLCAIFYVVTEVILPLYKPTEYSCVDISYIRKGTIEKDGETFSIEVPSNMGNNEQQFYSKKFLGKSVKVQWFDNYVKLSLHMSDSHVEDFIFTKVQSDYYSHHSSDGSVQCLLINRSCGLLKSLTLDSFDSENQFVFSLTFKP